MSGSALNRNENTKQKERRIRTLKPGEETAQFNMLNLCYNPWGSKEEWRRRYILHPDFDVTENVVIVEENGEWIGGGTAWFRKAILKNNKKVMVYGAGDLYVHPDHRGKGVYSTAMHSINQLAQEKGSVLGFAFPSIHRLPVVALPRYGFFEVFQPRTHVLVLNPERFFHFLVSRAKMAYLPEKYNGIKFKLAVSFNTPKGKHVLTEAFQVDKGKISELRGAPNEENVDLVIQAEISVFLKVMSSFYLGKGAFVRSLLSALLRRRLRFRFSKKFIRTFLGL